MVGRTLDRYQLLEQVGQGGMAVVHRALDVPLSREVAVKILHPHLAGHKEARSRLQREAQAVAKLRHPNILEIFSYSGIEAEDAYLVTEFIHGPTLKTFLSEHPLAFPEVGVMIASELAGALICAHRVGIIHRDVKPENVMIRDDGTVALCDFGIAQVVDKERMTATGQLLGSPAYMAPEHISGQPLDFRTDVFSLGVVLYQMVCGELPFRGRNPHETLKRIADGRFVPPEEHAPLCSAQLSRIVSRALARSPSDRYQSMTQLHEDLRAVLAEAGIDDPRKELAAYFKDPGGWEDAFRPRLVAALIDAGKRLKEAGRLAAALSTWGRAQHLSPDDAQVRALIRGITRRSRLRSLALGGGALLLGTALVLGLSQVRGRVPSGGGALTTSAPPALPRAPAPPPVEHKVPGPEPAAPQALSSTKVLPPPQKDARKIATQREKRDPARPPVTARARVVRLEPWPKAVTVSLNGTPLGAYGADVRTVELRPGTNELLFENPACYSERKVIGADESPTEVRVRLKWKPALLQVRSLPPGPADVDVLVDGRILGRSGQPLSLPVRSDDGRASYEVKISAAGYRTVSRTVELRANQASTLEISLQPL